MKVRIAYTINASDDYRMAIRHRYGRHGTLATRNEIRAHVERAGESMAADLMQEWQECTEGCQPGAVR